MVQGNIRRPLTRPRVMLVLTAFVAVFSWPFVATAQTACDDRKVIVDELAKTFSEIPVSIGLATNGSVVEVFASPKGTFTIVLTMPSGLSCVMAAGESWEHLPHRQGGVEIAAGKIAYQPPNGASAPTGRGPPELGYKVGDTAPFLHLCNPTGNGINVRAFMAGGPDLSEAAFAEQVRAGNCHDYRHSGYWAEITAVTYIGHFHGRHLFTIRFGDGGFYTVFIGP